MGRSFSCLAARSMASYNDDDGEDDVDYEDGMMMLMMMLLADSAFTVGRGKPFEPSAKFFFFTKMAITRERIV